MANLNDTELAVLEAEVVRVAATTPPEVSRMIEVTIGEMESLLAEVRAKRAKAVVTPADIAAQRARGWPDFHPEDHCHKCGASNPVWVTDRETWLIATAAWAAETGREGICCPGCFAEMHEVATGVTTIWKLSPA